MPQPDDSRLVRIIIELLRKTLRGEIEWEENFMFGTEAQSFSYSTEHFTIKIQSDYPLEAFPVEVSVRDSTGNVLETLRMADDSIVEFADGDLPLVQLFSVVRRQVLQVDDKMNQLLGELGLEERD